MIECDLNHPVWMTEPVKGFYSSDGCYCAAGKLFEACGVSISDRTLANDSYDIYAAITNGCGVIFNTVFDLNDKVSHKKAIFEALFIAAQIPEIKFKGSLDDLINKVSEKEWT